MSEVVKKLEVTHPEIAATPVRIDVTTAVLQVFVNTYLGSRGSIHGCGSG